MGESQVRWECGGTGIAMTRKSARRTTTAAAQGSRSATVCAAATSPNLLVLLSPPIHVFKRPTSPYTQYSFSLTTFSPSGKLVQIEYALNAVAAGATSLGISATDGVVIATEKKLPSMLVDEETVKKIAVLTPNCGMVYSGMGPDYRVLVRKARKTAAAYFRLYQEHIPVAQLVREVAAVMQEFTRERVRRGEGRGEWGLGQRTEEGLRRVARRRMRARALPRDGAARSALRTTCLLPPC